MKDSSAFVRKDKTKKKNRPFEYIKLHDKNDIKERGAYIIYIGIDNIYLY